MRIFALRYLDDLSKHKDLLQSYLKQQDDPEIRLEIVQSLKNYSDKELADQLLSIALDQGNPQLLRSEALFSLSTQPGVDFERIIPLLEEEENIQIEAARYLRPRINRVSVREAFEDKWVNLGPNSSSPLKQQLERGLKGERVDRPGNTSRKEWQALLEGKGDAERGRRVFYSTTSLCSACHSVEGRGGDLGPDLSNVGQSKDRNQLITSILQPSDEISPEWQGWYIRLNDSTVHQGRQIDVGSNSIKIYTQSKRFVSFDHKDIEDFGLIKNSLMPEGLERNLTDQDLKDLLAFLQKE